MHVCVCVCVCICNGTQKQGLVEVPAPTMTSPGPVLSGFWDPTLLCKSGLIFTLG